MNNGFTTIEINGEAIGLRFGMLANKMMAEKFFVDDSVMSNGVINEVGAAYLLYAGYYNNCVAEDIVSTHKLGFFVKYIEECQLDDSKKDVLQQVADTYKDSKFTVKYIEDLQKTVSNLTEELKKKTSEP